MSLTVPYPVSPSLAGEPNLEMNDGVGTSIIGYGSRQEVIGKWAKEFLPINGMSQLEKAKYQLFLAQLLIVDEDSIAVFIESDHVGFVAKPLREKVMKSALWLKSHRYPVISQAFITGDTYTKFMLRLRTSGKVVPGLMMQEELSVDSGDKVYLSDAQPYKIASNKIYYGTTTSSTINTIWNPI